MDDGQWLTIVIVVICIIVWFFVSLVKGGAAKLRQRTEQKAEIQLLVEKRFIDLMIEFPELDDLALATVMRDELQNKRITDGEFFRWATTETAGRIRRTLTIAAARAERKKSLSK